MLLLDGLETGRGGSFAVSGEVERERETLKVWIGLTAMMKIFVLMKKHLLRMEKLDIIERKKSSEKTDLCEYIKSNATIVQVKKGKHV